MGDHPKPNPANQLGMDKAFLFQHGIFSFPNVKSAIKSDSNCHNHAKTHSRVNKQVICS